MSRNPELEAILQARYELETCDPSEKTDRRERFDDLIRAALAKAGRKEISPRTFIEVTAEAYQEYKLSRKRQERARLSRLR